MKSKYHKEVKGVEIDVYDVLVVFGVSDPAVAHAIKKLLAGGRRGYKDYQQDLEEAKVSIDRAIELHQEFKEELKKSIELTDTFVEVYPQWSTTQTYYFGNVVKDCDGKLYQYNLQNSNEGGLSPQKYVEWQNGRECHGDAHPVRRWVVYNPEQSVRYGNERSHF